MKKRIISLLLTTAMGATLITGCGNGGQENSSGQQNQNDSQQGTSGEDGSAKGADDLSENRTISAWLYPDDYKYYSGYAENPSVKYLSEKFNITFDFQQPPMGSEQEQFNTMMGTGEYTDVFEITYSQDTTAVLYEDGIIRDLAPYLEDYMPNFYSFINLPENEDVHKALYDEEGHLFTLPSDVKDDDPVQWGGLVYRRDILETMTGGYVAFPSGNEDPVTVEDWDYMLELMSQYFTAANLADSACLILPSNGYFPTGELVNGFGTAGGFYVVDDVVKYGPTTQEFYNYLVKMHEWYEKGYIYQDFASRTNDLFYLPNTALTYGGAAGVWFGLGGQLSGRMSMPEYGLEVFVKGIPAPLDTANGQDGSLSGTLTMIAGRADSNSTGWVVSTACSDENMIRFMTMADYLYTEEGGLIKTCGLNAQQGAASEVYQQQGLENGAYYLDETGAFHWDALLDGTQTEEALDAAVLAGTRLPGFNLNSYTNSATEEDALEASDQWMKYGTGNNYPEEAQRTAEESETLTSLYTTYTDYLDTMVPKFIMGTEELNEETWASFVDKMNQLGVEESIRIRQEIYDRYNK